MAAQTLQNLQRGQQGGNKEQQPSFPAMLQKYQGEIARALPKHINPERMARMALTAFRRNAALANCDPRSIFAAVIQASQLGLEPDTMGRSYLIPYGKECQFVPGWKGLVDLVNRSGNATVYTGVIFKDQRYAFRDGSTRELVIENETELEDPEDITHAYAVGWIKGASMPVIELWRVGKIVKHRDRYNKVGKRHYSFQNFEMYARKVPLLQVLKYMPMSPELATALALNNAAETGTAQNLSLQDAIDGTYMQVDDDGVVTGMPGTATANASEHQAQGGSKAQGKAATSCEPTGTPLENACAELEKQTSEAALDEVYIRAEGLFEGADLEALLRKYRKVKAKLTGSLI